MMNGICASIIQELVYLNSVMQNQSNETDSYNFEPFEQSQDKEMTTNSKVPDDKSGEAKPVEDPWLEKFLQVMTSVGNNNTQTTSESSVKKQKILQ